MRRLVLLLMALCGCATVPMARQELQERARDLTPPADAANVYVYRPSNLLGTGLLGTAVKLYVFLDEVRVGVLTTSTFTVLTVRPGEHKLVVRAHGSSEQTLLVEPGRNYYVKATPTWGSGGADVNLEVVADEKLAREEIRGCGLIASAAAETIRRAAERIASVTVDPVEPEALVAEATRAVEAIVGPPGPSQPRDLDATIARLRASHPGTSDQELVFVGTMAMARSLRSKPAITRAIDGSCGLILRREGQGTVIAGVLPDSPAAVARVEAGLEVREVNGQPTRDHAPAEVVELLAGTAGSEVALTVGQPGEPDRKIVLRRALADAGAVDCRVIGGRVLYLRPWGSWAATARRVRDHGRSAGAPASLVILDLRGNLGGNVSGARDLADSFLAGGPMFSVAGARVPGVDGGYNATPGTSALEQARLVALVDANTTGFAEALAAAIQDNRRGTVLGTRTAGMAKIELVYEVAGMKLSIPVARIFRASRQPLDGHGVTPDVVGAPVPTPGPIMSDVACPTVASPGRVSDDPLVRRAIDLLLASADAAK